MANLVTVLLTALSLAGCARTPLYEYYYSERPELSVSIYIPEMSTTKAETGNVGALNNEKVINTLQLWVFIHGGDNDGALVGYKDDFTDQLTETGLPYSTTTRFGMPLSWFMFNALSDKDARVDVYAVANAASATDIELGKSTTRGDLEGIVMSGSTFGTDLTMAVPAAGLPMSGMLKEAKVTGSYPVLNVSTVTLTRAVSKIRFVFSQQAKPATNEPSNKNCVIKSIKFGGASMDCQIATEEKLFTDKKLEGADDLFDISGYTPLKATLPGKSNAEITILEHPEDLLFRGEGYEGESAQEYEDRIEEVIAASSQLGPIYIRETDRRIAGTITYNIGEEDLTANFSMPSDNYLTRNHSWILYAYFSETTKTLQLKIVVLPWDKTSYDMDFTTSPDIVNVIRRFTIPETDPYTFAKVQNINGYFDIHFWPILDDEPNSIKGDILIDSPVGQTICIVPIAGAEDGYSPVDNIFSIVSITPREHTILSPNHEHPENSVSEDSVVEYTIQCNIPDGFDVNDLEGNYIDLHFCVKIVDGDKVRWIDLDTESIDYYRVYFHSDWKSYLPKEEEEEEEGGGE